MIHRDCKWRGESTASWVSPSVCLSGPPAELVGALSNPTGRRFRFLTLLRRSVVAQPSMDRTNLVNTGNALDMMKDNKKNPPKWHFC